LFQLLFPRWELLRPLHLGLSPLGDDEVIGRTRDGTGDIGIEFLFEKIEEFLLLYREKEAETGRCRPYTAPTLGELRRRLHATASAVVLKNSYEVSENLYAKPNG
jgi:hypothetical protein